MAAGSLCILLMAWGVGQGGVWPFGPPSFEFVKLVGRPDQCCAPIRFGPIESTDGRATTFKESFRRRRVALWTLPIGAGLGQAQGT